MKALLYLLLFFTSISYAETFTVAAYEWEPFIDSKRKDGGISIEFIRRIMQNQGHDIKALPMPWSRSLAMLKKHKIDILPAVWFTQERTNIMLYSKPYTSNRLVFVKAKGSQYEYHGLSSLHNKTVAIIRNYAYGEEFLNDRNIKFSITESLSKNVKRVSLGRADLTIDDEIVIKTTIKPELLQEVELTKNALSESPLYITCDKENPKCPLIIDAFNLGFKSMQSDGSLKTLFQQLGL